MAWERRPRGGWYYTRSRRVGGRVVREYVGTGLLAGLEAEMDAEDRAAKMQQREELRAEQQRWADVEEPVTTLCEMTELMARAALVLAGYHQHKVNVAQ